MVPNELLGLRRRAARGPLLVVLWETQTRARAVGKMFNVVQLPRMECPAVWSTEGTLAEGGHGGFTIAMEPRTSGWSAAWAVPSLNFWSDFLSLIVTHPPQGYSSSQGYKHCGSALPRRRWYKICGTSPLNNFHQGNQWRRSIRIWCLVAWNRIPSVVFDGRKTFLIDWMQKTWVIFF